MWENVPPLGALGLTYSKCGKSAGYLRSPNPEMPWVSVSSAAWMAKPDPRRISTGAAIAPAARTSARRRDGLLSSLTDAPRFSPLWQGPTTRQSEMRRRHIWGARPDG